MIMNEVTRGREGLGRVGSSGQGGDRCASVNWNWIVFASFFKFFKCILVVVGIQKLFFVRMEIIAQVGLEWQFLSNLDLFLGTGFVFSFNQQFYQVDRWGLEGNEQANGQQKSETQRKEYVFKLKPKKIPETMSMVHMKSVYLPVRECWPSWWALGTGEHCTKWSSSGSCTRRRTSETWAAKAHCSRSAPPDAQCPSSICIWPRPNSNTKWWGRQQRDKHRWSHTFRTLSLDPVRPYSWTGEWVWWRWTTKSTTWSTMLWLCALEHSPTTFDLVLHQWNKVSIASLVRNRAFGLHRWEFWEKQASVHWNDSQTP